MRETNVPQMLRFMADLNLLNLLFADPENPFISISACFIVVNFDPVAFGKCSAISEPKFM